MTFDPTVVARVRHDPAVIIERLETDGFEVERPTVAGGLVLMPGYGVMGTIGAEIRVVPLSDDNALYWWSNGWWHGRYHERYHAAPPARPRRRRARARLRRRP